MFNMMISNLKYFFMEKSREKKYQQFICLTKPSTASTILDIGIADKEYSPYDNYLEKRYPYQSKITGLSICHLRQFPKSYPEIQVVVYNGGKFPFRDKEFSISFSNAVIEHVGNFEKQVLFIKEMKRVAHQFYFTTPAKEFPLEIHTNYPIIHWLSNKTFDSIITKLGKGWASGDYMNLLKKRDIEHLLKSAEVKKFKILTHKFCLFPLHYAVWGMGDD